MATMRPVLSEEQLRALPSQAEARFYRACRDQLSADVLVIHSASWVFRDALHKLAEGEADFTLAFPRAGVLTVEVKGGGIAYDPARGQWTSTDRRGTAHEIKDPFRQAQSERFAILGMLKRHPRWRTWPGRRLTTGHAVMFPDLRDVRPFVNGGRDPELVGGQAEMAALQAWTDAANRFWREARDDVLGPQGVALVEEIICGPVDVRALLRTELAYAEEVFVRLTEQQSRILRSLGGRNRVVIAGGAGTGKTLLAVEKARQLAEEGKAVLLLCYNRPLADFLANTLAQTQGVEVASYHQLCDRRIVQTQAASGRDLLQEALADYPGRGDAHKFEVLMPFALALSCEILTDHLFDSVIVDEAQDFSDEYWLGIVSLLKDPDGGDLYLFTDQNQAIYKRKAELPVTEPPFHLTFNCRNAAPIHKMAYGFYRGLAVDVPEAAGPDVETVCLPSDGEQATEIARRVGHLLSAEGFQPSDIVVLLAKKPKAALLRLLAAHRLPGKVLWGEDRRSPNTVLVETVGRFKGLESPVVLVWLGEEAYQDSEPETLYVATSRAKYLMIVVGTKAACDALLPKV